MNTLKMTDATRATADKENARWCHDAERTVMVVDAVVGPDEGRVWTQEEVERAAEVHMEAMMECITAEQCDRVTMEFITGVRKWQ